MTLNWFDAKECRPTDNLRRLLVYRRVDDNLTYIMEVTSIVCDWKDVLYWAFAPTLEDVEDEVW